MSLPAHSVLTFLNDRAVPSELNPTIGPMPPHSARWTCSPYRTDAVASVARSLGLAYQPDADVLAAALPIARAVPGGKARTRAGAPFAPGLPVPAQVGLLDQIVAMLGRSPAWPELRPGGRLP